MRSEPDVTGFDAELLREITDEHPALPVKRLAALANRDKSTVYRYLDGQKTIPCDVLRAAFEATFDQRLLRLVSGRVPMVFVLAGNGQSGAGVAEGDGFPLRLPPISDLLSEACDSVERAAESVKHMAAIVADNRIDQSDAGEITQFQRDASAAMEHLAVVLAALDAHVGRDGDGFRPAGDRQPGIVSGAVHRKGMKR